MGFLLLFLTIVIIAAPNLLNYQREKSLLQSRNLWEYEEKRENMATGAQVARLYADGEIDSGNLWGMKGQNLASKEVKETAIDILEPILQKDKELFEWISRVINEESGLCEKHTLLTLIDNSAVALNFVYTEFYGENGNLILLYEEKTSVVIYCEYGVYREDILRFMIDFSPEKVEEYYLEELKLYKDEFFWTQDNVENYFVYSFGISQELEMRREYE